MKVIRMLTFILAFSALANIAHAGRGLELIYFDSHIHTTHSDGTGAIADVKQVARKRGLNAVFVTNHTRQINDMDVWNEIVAQCETLSEKDFLMIPSFEITGSEGLFCRDHVLAWGVRRPFVGDPADALAPEEVWESPENPFGTGPMYPENIRRWTDWIHQNGGIAVHAHTSGTTQLSYNADFIEVINLSHIKNGEIIFADEPMSAAYEIQLEDTVSEDSYFRVAVISMEADGKPRFAYANPVFVMDDGCKR